MTGVLNAGAPRYDGPGPDAGNRPPSPSPRRLLGEPTKGSARWVLALAMFGAIMATSLSLNGVLASFSWWPPSAVVVAATLLPAALLRRWPVLAPFAPVGAMAGWFLGLTIVFFPATAILGFLPTTGTVEAAVELAAEAATVITTGSAPVPAVSAMSFLVAAGLGFVALVIDTVALTLAMPAASALGLVLVMLPPALTTTDGIGGWGLACSAAGFLLILGCSRWYAPGGKLRPGGNVHPSGTLSRAVALGTVVVLLMAAVPVAIPGFSKGAFPQGTRLGQGSGATQLDPMIALGVDLRAQSDSVAVTYLSSTSTAQYLRLNTLEDFTGKAWQPSALPDGLKAGVTGLAPVPAVPSTLPRTRDLTWISTIGLQSSWLPTPLSPTSIENLDGSWVWNPSTQTIKAKSSSTLGQSYVVNSEMPVLSRDLLAAATRNAGADVDPIYTQLPKDVPKILRTTAAEAAGSLQSPYAKAVALQDYLRSGLFSYSLDTPVEEGYDGSGMKVLASFLQKRSGYCVHFSAAMAVMSRELGIPSRIAVGYAPGASTDESRMRNGRELRGFQATGLDAHAWPELYFAGVGWVPFEPTPSRGSVPDYSLELSAPAPNDGGPTAPVVEENPVQSASATPSTAAAAAGSTAGATHASQWLLVPGTTLLVLFLLGAPALARVLVRRRRLAQVRNGNESTVVDIAVQAVADTVADAAIDTVADAAVDIAGTPPLVAWRELLATATDYGCPADRSLTPALNAARIAQLTGPAASGALDLLLHSYERAVYGRSEVSAGAGLSGNGREDLAEALETLIARIQTRATPWQRLRATLVPASFFTRAPGRRGSPEMAAPK